MLSPTRSQVCRLSIFSSAAIWLCALSASAQQPSPSPPPEELKWGLYSVPRSFFISPDPKDQNKGWKMAPGVMPLPGEKEGLFDVKAVLEQTGIKQPPGSVAIFSQLSSVLVTRNSKENTDLTDVVVNSTDCGFAMVLKATLSVVEYALPPKNGDWNSPSPLAYAELERLVSGSIKVLSMATTQGRSGHLQRSESVLRPADSERTEKKAGELPRFERNETGIRFKVEPTLGPDQQALDIDLDARFQVAMDGGKPKTFLEGKATFSSFIWIGCPVVVQSFRKPGGKGEFVALILRIDFANPAGWKIPAR